MASAALVLMFGTVVTAEAKRSGLTASIRKAMPAGSILALWYFDLANPAMRNSPWKYRVMRRIAPTLDWLVMTDHSYAWEQHAPQFLHLMQGVDPADFEGKVWPPEPRARDIIFTGGYHKSFDDRAEAIRLLKTRFRVGAFGAGIGPAIYGQDFFLQYQRSRVAFVPAPIKEATHDYWSNRVYLATATGTPCVVGYTPGIEKHFEDGKEALFYHDNRELIQQTALLVDDPELREWVGFAGRARTLSEHTYTERCKTLMAAIFGGGA
jgi:hypothetical protein